jgi:hypothetical protein
MNSFGYKNTIFTPMKDFEAPRDALSSPERTSGSSKHEIYQFFHCFGAILLKQNPDCKSGSGDPLNPDPMRILIRNTGLAEERRGS